MAAEIVWRAPRAGDAASVAARMRAADVAECRAAGLDDPLRALEQSIETSVIRFTIQVDGAPAAITGLAPLGGALIGDTGVPWLLGTDQVRQHARALIRQAGPYIRSMLRVYPVLLNFVHAENHAAIGRLKRTGFEMHPAAPYGARGEMFHRFEMHRHV